MARKPCCCQLNMTIKCAQCATIGVKSSARLCNRCLEWTAGVVKVRWQGPYMAGTAPRFKKKRYSSEVQMVPASEEPDVLAGLRSTVPPLPSTVSCCWPSVLAASAAGVCPSCKILRMKKSTQAGSAWGRSGLVGQALWQAHVRQLMHPMATQLCHPLASDPAHPCCMRGVRHAERS